MNKPRTQLVGWPTTKAQTASLDSLIIDREEVGGRWALACVHGPQAEDAGRWRDVRRAIIFGHRAIVIFPDGKIEEIQ